MLDNTPSLSNGLGVNVVETVFSQRQVSTIKKAQDITCLNVITPSLAGQETIPRPHSPAPRKIHVHLQGREMEREKLRKEM